MNNNIVSNINLFDGLNINPIPLEFSQEMTTTKWLCAMQTKINTLVDFLNTWYDIIVKDFENDGVLYKKLTDILVTEFNTSIAEINKAISDMNTAITNNKTTLDNEISLIQKEISDINYIKPSITITTSPNQLIYNVGESINSVLVNYNITKGSNDITEVKLYRNNILVNSIINNIPLNSNIVDGSVITTDAEYRVEINDGKNIVSSNSISIKFIYNYYFGVSYASDTINSIFIKNLTPLKTLKQNITEEFNCQNQKIIFAYPTSYGDLLEVLCSSINYLQSFTKSIISIDNVNYNVYIANNYLSDIFDLSFNII